MWSRLGDYQSKLIPFNQLEMTEMQCRECHLLMGSKCTSPHCTRTDQATYITLTKYGTYCDSHCMRDDGQLDRERDESDRWEYEEVFCNDHEHRCGHCLGVGRDVDCDCDKGRSLYVCDSGSGKITCSSCECNCCLSYDAYWNTDPCKRRSRISQCSCSSSPTFSISDYMWAITKPRLDVAEISVDDIGPMMRVRPELTEALKNFQVHDAIGRIIEEYAGVFSDACLSIFDSLCNVPRKLQDADSRMRGLQTLLSDIPFEFGIGIGVVLDGPDSQVIHFIERTNDTIPTLGDICGYFGRAPSGSWKWTRDSQYDWIGEQSFLVIELGEEVDWGFGEE